MLRLADTSIRVYRKGNGAASLRLRSYLLVKASVGFRLSAYLRNISCQLTLPSGQTIPFDQVGISHEMRCPADLDTMVYDFWASAVGGRKLIKNGLGTLKLTYRLSFTNHPSEGFKSFETVVPIIRRAASYTY